MQYLMIDGHGDPNSSQEFADALEALYPVAYKLKFASKQDLGRDFAKLRTILRQPVIATT
jgi:hypothetical protein